MYYRLATKRTGKKTSRRKCEPAFLPRDATQSAVMRLHVVCPSVRLSVRLSVCLSVTFRYRDQIGWNSSKIISRPNSLRPMRSLMPNTGDLVQREHSQN